MTCKAYGKLHRSSSPQQNRYHLLKSTEKTFIEEATALGFSLKLLGLCVLLPLSLSPFLILFVFEIVNLKFHNTIII